MRLIKFCFNDYMQILSLSRTNRIPYATFHLLAPFHVDHLSPRQYWKCLEEQNFALYFL